MFQLTDEEISALSRSQNVTLNKGAGYLYAYDCIKGRTCY